MISTSDKAIKLENVDVSDGQTLIDVRALWTNRESVVRNLRNMWQFCDWWCELFNRKSTQSVASVFSPRATNNFP